MIDDEKMKVGDEIAFHWGDEAPDTVIVITHWDGCERCAVCVKESAEMDENRKAFSTCNPVVKADGGREMNDDTISRRMAIDALFELYEYQRDIDPTEAADLVRQGIYLAEKKIEQLPSAQPELLEHEAYIRGFEQGRTQGMIDAQERKK